MEKFISLEQRVNSASDAALLKGNPAFREIMQILSDDIDSRMAAISTTDPEACKDIIRQRQILDRMSSVINRMIDDGKVARKELELIASRKKPGLFVR